MDDDAETSQTIRQSTRYARGGAGLEALAQVARVIVRAGVAWKRGKN
jgi:hypothetical protein